MLQSNIVIDTFHIGTKTQNLGRITFYLNKKATQLALGFTLYIVLPRGFIYSFTYATIG